MLWMSVQSEMAGGGTVMLHVFSLKGSPILKLFGLPYVSPERNPVPDSQQEIQIK